MGTSADVLRQLAQMIHTVQRAFHPLSRSVHCRQVRPPVTPPQGVIRLWYSSRRQNQPAAAAAAAGNQNDRLTDD
jgi:hypothetical protein